MNDIATILKSVLTEIKGNDFSQISPDLDLIQGAEVDSIEFIELFFKTEQKLNLELEFYDLKMFCRSRRAAGDLRILFGDVVDYIDTVISKA